VVKRSIQHCLDRHDNRPTPYIRALAKTLKRIAQHWVGKRIFVHRTLTRHSAEPEMPTRPPRASAM
jgi:hypothetical protein